MEDESITDHTIATLKVVEDRLFHHFKYLIVHTCGRSDTHLLQLITNSDTDEYFVTLIVMLDVFRHRYCISVDTVWLTWLFVRPGDTHNEYWYRCELIETHIWSHWWVYGGVIDYVATYDTLLMLMVQCWCLIFFLHLFQKISHSYTYVFRKLGDFIFVYDYEIN